MARGNRTIRTAQLAAGALTITDWAYAWVLGRRVPWVDRVLGASTGPWRDWGVGALAGFAVVQTPAALRPTSTNLAQLAAARAVVAAGHVSGLAIRRGRDRLPVASLLTVNAAVAGVAWRASRRLR